MKPNSIKSSQADSSVKKYKFSVSGTDSLPIFRVLLTAMTWCVVVQDQQYPEDGNKVNA
jgi:hypothetical protein